MPQITMYTSNSCADCIRIKAALDQHGYKYQEINIEEQPEFIPFVENLSGGYRSVPAIIIEKAGQEIILIEPSRTELLLQLSD